MDREDQPAWRRYENVAQFLLERLGDKLGLGIQRVEGKQKLMGTSGMNWEIDAKGVMADDNAIVVIECRRYTTSSLEAEDVAALAYKIGDVGASGGILITPIGVQRGGQLIADAEGIQVVHLDADSTTTEYLLRFLGDVFVGPGSATHTLTGGTPEIIIAPAEPDE